MYHFTVLIPTYAENKLVSPKIAAYDQSSSYRTANCSMTANDETIVMYWLVADMT